MGYLRVRNADIARLHLPIERQVAAVREFHGCEHYSIGRDVLEPDLLRVAERWRTRAAQAAHMVGDHMVEFNIGMRAASVVATAIESYESGIVRRLLQIPATSFRPEYEDRNTVVVLGDVRCASGEIDRMQEAIDTQVRATRAEDGCELYAFSRDVLDPEVLHIAEKWRDHAALTAHFATPHMAVFNAELGAAKVVSMSVKAYDAEGERVLVER
ncbi:putative quinol monooxygenase [Sphingomonas sp. SUN039]|uniref:putative quinol monooxygenase n=1 Tax=Sphingomonas sp. SUN039 TaxID=2937787 RepID=UPI0021648188|nr:antibiotic biosynthesis monooxygenase [Sphingomonas sp. SUN039]UVO52758.1 antibiotic biosynthesis monooxygenase [Sphingomonas sp. SUN039]